ncbi:hypothetical protein BS47DRAFT_1298204 [Hydnum rufescens UP504]|uniref:YCII-related domain-containing protein n=1 Tax=Hydnum rufescens UP504 TaxID=1448309 RepID=A0A9P6AU77_9AGAM|nr:hypothetical protein BS47DRAFT_1298204 [Hydnum rufescens UP504]
MSDALSKHLFLVYAPDLTDPDAFARRMAARERHVANAATLGAKGFIKVGGALLTPESITGGERKLIGSTLIVESTDIESVRKVIEADIYYTSNVWDPKALVITPFLASKI